MFHCRRCEETFPHPRAVAAHSVVSRLSILGNRYKFGVYLSPP